MAPDTSSFNEEESIDKSAEQSSENEEQKCEERIAFDKKAAALNCEMLVKRSKEIERFQIHMSI